MPSASQRKTSSLLDLGVAVYYRLSEFPFVIGGAPALREQRLAEYLWNVSLPGVRTRLIIDRDADGNRVDLGYEFDHTLTCGLSGR